MNEDEVVKLVREIFERTYSIASAVGTLKALIPRPNLQYVVKGFQALEQAATWRGYGGIYDLIVDGRDYEWNDPV